MTGAFQPAFTRYFSAAMALIRLFIAAVAGLIGMLLLAPIVVLWAAFELVACITKQGARFFEANVVESNQLIEFTPKLGWKPKANFDGHYLTTVKDGVYHAVTDAQGWPGGADLERSEVVVFGDSYAFGYGVNTAATFWRQKNGASVKSIGAPGYNMVQELLLMKQFSGNLRGKLVVWFIYFGNDLYDNLVPNNQHYRTPFVRKPANSEAWLITTEHVSPANWPNHSNPKYYERLSEFCCDTPLAERAYSACEYLIGEAQKICDSAGADLVLMTIPDAIQLNEPGCQKLAASAPNKDSFAPDLPDKKIREIGARLGVAVVSLKDHLTLADYKKRDPHWNERGHRRVAQVIAELRNGLRSKSKGMPVRPTSGSLAANASRAI